MRNLLPQGWALWHPIVFGLLATIGMRLADPVVNFALGLLRNVG